ncbi:uncharacterized protein LOC144440168 [Glandiceps talaboti]
MATENGTSQRDALNHDQFIPTSSECQSASLFNEKDGDIYLYIDSTPYYAHKRVLSEVSTVFRDLFKEDVDKNGQTGDGDAMLQLTESDECLVVFPVFLRSFYYGAKSVELSTDNVIPLLILSIKYKVEPLWIRCLDWMRKYINDRKGELNIVIDWTLHGYMRCAPESQIQQLQQECANVVKSNMDDVSEKWVNLPLDCILTLLETDDLQVVDEHALYNAVEKWFLAKYQEHAQTDILQKILPLVRFDEMSPSQLSSIKDQSVLYSTHETTFADYIEGEREVSLQNGNITRQKFTTREKGRLSKPGKYTKSSANHQQWTENSDNSENRDEESKIMTGEFRYSSDGIVYVEHTNGTLEKTSSPTMVDPNYDITYMKVDEGSHLTMTDRELGGNSADANVSPSNLDTSDIRTGNGTPLEALSTDNIPHKLPVNRALPFSITLDKSLSRSSSGSGSDSFMFDSVKDNSEQFETEPADELDSFLLNSERCEPSNNQIIEHETSKDENGGNHIPTTTTAATTTTTTVATTDQSNFIQKEISTLTPQDKINLDSRNLDDPSDRSGHPGDENKTSVFQKEERVSVFDGKNSSGLISFMTMEKTEERNTDMTNETGAKYSDSLEKTRIMNTTVESAHVVIGTNNINERYLKDNSVENDSGITTYTNILYRGSNDHRELQSIDNVAIVTGEETNVLNSRRETGKPNQKLRIESDALKSLQGCYSDEGSSFDKQNKFSRKGDNVAMQEQIINCEDGGIIITDQLDSQLGNQLSNSGAVSQNATAEIRKEDQWTSEEMGEEDILEKRTVHEMHTQQNLEAAMIVELPPINNVTNVVCDHFATENLDKHSNTVTGRYSFPETEKVVTQDNVDSSSEPLSSLPSILKISETEPSTVIKTPYSEDDEIEGMLHSDEYSKAMFVLQSLSKDKLDNIDLNQDIDYDSETVLKSTGKEIDGVVTMGDTETEMDADELLHAVYLSTQDQLVRHDPVSVCSGDSADREFEDDSSGPVSVLTTQTAAEANNDEANQEKHNYAIVSKNIGSDDNELRKEKNSTTFDKLWMGEENRSGDNITLQIFEQPAAVLEPDDQTNNNVPLDSDARLEHERQHIHEESVEDDVSKGARNEPIRFDNHDSESSQWQRKLKMQTLAPVDIPPETDMNQQHKTTDSENNPDDVNHKVHTITSDNAKLQENRPITYPIIDGQSEVINVIDTDVKVCLPVSTLDGLSNIDPNNESNDEEKMSCATLDADDIEEDMCPKEDIYKYNTNQDKHDCAMTPRVDASTNTDLTVYTDSEMISKHFKLDTENQGNNKTDVNDEGDIVAEIENENTGKQTVLKTSANTRNDVQLVDSESQCEIERSGDSTVIITRDGNVQNYDQNDKGLQCDLQDIMHTSAITSTYSKTTEDNVNDDDDDDDENHFIADNIRCTSTDEVFEKTSLYVETTDKAVDANGRVTRKDSSTTTRENVATETNFRSISTDKVFAVLDMLDNDRVVSEIQKDSKQTMTDPEVVMTTKTTMVCQDCLAARQEEVQNKFGNGGIKSTDVIRTISEFQLRKSVPVYKVKEAAKRSGNIPFLHGKLDIGVHPPIIETHPCSSSPTKVKDFHFHPQLPLIKESVVDDSNNQYNDAEVADITEHAPFFKRISESSSPGGDVNNLPDSNGEYVDLEKDVTFQEDTLLAKKSDKTVQDKRHSIESEYPAIFEDSDEFESQESSTPTEDIYSHEDQRGDNFVQIYDSEGVIEFLTPIAEETDECDLDESGSEDSMENDQDETSSNELQEKLADPDDEKHTAIYENTTKTSILNEGFHTEHDLTGTGSNCTNSPQLDDSSKVVHSGNTLGEDAVKLNLGDLEKISISETRSKEQSEEVNTSVSDTIENVSSLQSEVVDASDYLTGLSPSYKNQNESEESKDNNIMAGESELCEADDVFAGKTDLTAVVFKWTDSGRFVAIAGEFNHWKAESMTYDDREKCFLKEYDLGDGEHQYKYVVDGRWRLKSDEGDIQGPFGPNHVVRIKDGKRLGDDIKCDDDEY